jgi:nucleotide-binding universal stress UspA family protein
MHVMIATDGSLDPESATMTVARLVGDEGRVTVLSVVEVPRAMLDDMRQAANGSDSPGRDVEYRSHQASESPHPSWVGDDAIVSRYVNNQLASRTGDLVAALDAAGVKHSLVGLEGENAARTVLDRVESDDVDILVIGTHGLGRFEGLLGSTSTKLARRAPCSVLLVR